jgi:hypothetical protein
MADLNTPETAVEFDALKAGFDAAMTRVKNLELDPRKTLVDMISAEDWAAWDQSDENAYVADADAFDDNGVEGSDGQLAA